MRVAGVHPPPPVWQADTRHDAITEPTTWVRDTPDSRLIVAGDLNALLRPPRVPTMGSPGCASTSVDPESPAKDSFGPGPVTCGEGGSQHPIRLNP